MDDLISRQVAIDAVMRLSLGETNTIRLAMRVCDYLERLPSVQSERPKGYMKIEVISMLDGEDLVCENCGEYCLSPSYKFCPKCGIEFIGVRDE